MQYKVYHIFFKIRLQNDDVQDFDTRWDQALSAAIEIPTEMVLEGFFRSNLQDSVQLQNVLAFYEQEIVSKQRTAKLLQIEDNGKTSYGSDNEDAKLQSPERDSGKRSSNQESKRNKASAERGKQLDNVRKETHVVSVMIPRLETDAIRDKKDNRLLMHPKGKHRLTERNQKVQAAEEKVLLEQEGRIPCRHLFGRKCTNPSCNYWHPPVCLITSLNQDAADGQPTKI